MYMNSFCKNLSIRLTYSVKAEGKKNLKKIIFKLEQHLAMRYLPVACVLPGCLF